MGFRPFVAVMAGFVVMLAGAMSAVRADIHNVPNTTGALAGKTVVVSAGHGSGDGGGWDRGVVHNLREDIHTNELVAAWVTRYLNNAGARVFTVREREFIDVEIIVDNGSAGYSETGTWTTSTSATDFYGADYRVHAVTTASHATATFTPNFPKSGEYPVYVWYPPGSNRNTAATYTVNHPGGQSPVAINQQLYNGSWIYLGTWHFDAGQNTATGSVTLSSAGSDPAKYSIADAVRFGGGTNAVTGYHLWKDDGYHFTSRLGYPNTSGFGDVTVRPNFAGWQTKLTGSDFATDWRYLAIHSNASGTQPNTTARGTSTFTYSNGRTAAWGTNGPASHPVALQTASDTFGARVQGQFVADMRANWEAGWQDRQHMIMNFGELRDCLRMPSALIEICFHDHATDAGYIRQDRWRHDAARALYKAIAKDFDPNAVIVPLPPTNFRVVQTGAGEFTARWDAVTDPNEASATPSGYKIYRSPDGRSWDDGTAVGAGTSATFSVPAGQVVFVRVAATNAGGESFCTQALAVRASDAASHGGVLFVYGFDRQFIYEVTDVAGNDDPTNTLQRYRDDYIAAPAKALAAYAGKQIYFDSATNEAIENGYVDLKDYHAVIWLLGEESTADHTFSAAEQTAVSDYLANAANANLFVSGAEVGWDLDFKGSAADKAFIHNELGASYASDDAGTHSVTGTAGGPFAGLSFDFGDGTSGYLGDYNVDYPDVFGTSNGSVAVFDYTNAAGPAATMRTLANGKVIVMGFPYERILGTANQEAVMAAVAGELLAAYVAPVGNGGGGGAGNNGGKGGCMYVGATPDSAFTALMLLGLIGGLLVCRRLASAG